jgi:hypothetical protein
VVIEMISDKLDQNAGANGFIFDGFPRTVAQAEALDKLLHEKNTGISMMLALEVDDEELTKRLLLRGKESGRPDDQDEEIIRKRIQEYNNKTAPLKDYYLAQNKYRSVHGVGSIDEIFEGLCNAINFTQSEKTPKETPVEEPESEGLVAKVVDMVKSVFSSDNDEPKPVKKKVAKAAPDKVKVANKPAAKKEVKPAGKAQVKPAAKKVIAKKKVKTAAKAVKPAGRSSVKKAAAKKIQNLKASAKKKTTKPVRKAVKKVTAKKTTAKKVTKKTVKTAKKTTPKKVVSRKPVKKVVKKQVKKVASRKSVKKAGKKVTVKKIIKTVKKAAKKIIKKVAKKTVKKGNKRR